MKLTLPEIIVLGKIVKRVSGKLVGLLLFIEYIGLLVCYCHFIQP